jgi:hypothetical protein
VHMSQPGPHGQVNAARWRRWLFPAALAAGLVTLLAVSGGPPARAPLTYTKFVADVGAGMVRAVTIGPAGQVSGSLADGHAFTTTIPVALGGNTSPLIWLPTTSRSLPPPACPLRCCRCCSACCRWC